MPKQYSWANDDGLVVRSGRRTVEGADVANVTATEGRAKELRVVFGLNKGIQTVGTGDLNATQMATEAWTNGAIIPNGARITRVYQTVSGANLTGATNATVTLYQSRDTTVAADRGKRVGNAAAAFGTTVADGTTVISTAPVAVTNARGVQVGLNVAGAAITAGVFEVVIEYEIPVG